MKTANIIFLIIEGQIVPSGNTLTMHWAKRAKLIDRWYEIIRCANGNIVWEKLPQVKCRVTVTRYAPRMLDIANFTHAVDKLILDNIKCNVRKRIPVRTPSGYTYKSFITTGLIYDDSPKYLDLILNQQPSGGNPRMEIKVERI